MDKVIVGKISAKDGWVSAPGCLAAAFLPAPAAAAAAVAPRGVPAGRRPVSLVAGDEHVPRPERLRPVVLRGGGSDGSEQRIQDQL